MTKTKKIFKTSDTSIEQKSTFSCWVNPSVPVMRCWKVLPSLRCSVMVSPGHNTGMETFQEQIKLYELWITHEAASEPVQAISGSLLLFLLAFPPFFSIPDVPLEVRRKILQIRNASNHLILNNSNSTAVGSWWVLSWTGTGVLSRAGNEGPWRFYSHVEGPN